MAFDDGIVREKAVCKFVLESGEEHCKRTKESYIISVIINKICTLRLTE